MAPATTNSETPLNVTNCYSRLALRPCCGDTCCSEARASRFFIPNTMRQLYIPLRPNAALLVLFLILAAFKVAGSDETRLERSCLSYVQNAAACQRF
jgi:hypothetical protein